MEEWRYSKREGRVERQDRGRVALLAAANRPPVAVEGKEGIGCERGGDRTSDTCHGRMASRLWRGWVAVVFLNNMGPTRERSRFYTLQVKLLILVNA